MIHPSVKFIPTNKFSFFLLRSTFLTVILVCITGLYTFAQTEEAIKGIMSESDQKKYDKAEKYKTDGDKLTEEANQLYLQTFEVQGNYDLDEKTVQKKVKDLESKAAKKQFEAALDYQKSTESRYKLLKAYSKKFWDDYDGDQDTYTNAKLIEEQAADFYYKANTKRRDAGKEREDKAKITALNDAYDLENQAIEKMVTALGFYYGLTAPGETAVQNTEPENTNQQNNAEVSYPQTPQNEPQPATVPVSSGTVSTDTPTQQTAGANGNVQINQEMVDKYKRYVDNDNIPPPIVITKNGVGDITSFNANDLTKLWDEYRTDSLNRVNAATSGPASPQTSNESKDTIPELADNTAVITPENNTVSDNSSNKTNEPQYEKIDTVQEEISNTALVPADEKVIYRVQLAANKAELPQQALQQIYMGNKKVEMINEDGWFKYSVGDFDTFEAANQFKTNSGVKNAFIVAYRRGTRFESTNEQPSVADNTPVTPSAGISNVTSKGMVFRIQVAASRTPLTREQIAGIYKGDCSLEVIEEDGWYKYQIGDFSLYSDAARIKNITPVKGIFIVAYDNGEKLKLADAVQQIKTLENDVRTYGRRGTIKEISFNVQIAASKLPLSETSLRQIYSGNGDILLLIEEGWYKYQLKAGTVYETAKQIKDQSGVNQAFIVAYKQGKKMPLYQAVKESEY